MRALCRGVDRPHPHGARALQPVPRGDGRAWAGRCSVTSTPSSSMCSTRPANGCAPCSRPTTRSRCRSAARARRAWRRRSSTWSSRATRSSSASTACSASAWSTSPRAAARWSPASTPSGGRRSIPRRCWPRTPNPAIIALVHAETSTGVRNDVAPIGAAKPDGALLLVDCVTSIAGIELDVDGWGIDIAYAGTQKCLGVPPGLAPLTYSPSGARPHRGEAAELVPRPDPDRRVHRVGGGAAPVPPHRADLDDLRAARRTRRRARRRACASRGSATPRRARRCRTGWRSAASN